MLAMVFEGELLRIVNLHMCVVLAVLSWTGGNFLPFLTYEVFMVFGGHLISYRLSLGPQKKKNILRIFLFSKAKVRSWLACPRATFSWKFLKFSTTFVLIYSGIFKSRRIQICSNIQHEGCSNRWRISTQSCSAASLMDSFLLRVGQFFQNSLFN